jgi:CRP/FNR family cyclic AMP-dependent transcriptional regulator
VSGPKADIVDLLGETHLLAGWSRDELAGLAQAMEVRPVEPEETLFEAGLPGDALYLLLEGRLSVWRERDEIGDILEGDHLGEGALVRPGPRRVAVRGADPSTVAVLSGAAFVGLSESNPAVHAKLLRALLRESAGKMADAEALLDSPQKFR